MFEAGAIAYGIQMLGIQVFQQDGAKAEQTIKKVGDSADQATPKVKKSGEAVDSAGKAAKAAKAPLDDTAKSTKQVGDESAKASPKVATVTKSVEQMKRESAAASTTVGTAFLGIGAAIATMAVVAVSRFANFDQGMSNLKATTHDTAEEQKKLASAALDAGAKTTFTAREAADAENELAKAGLNVHQILTGGLTGSLALAAAGELGVARAGEIAATTLQQFGLKGSEAGHVADVLAAGANKAIGSVDDLANGLKFVGPIAHGMNISLEETVGTLALFAASGVVGEQGGTALRGMLSSLTSPSRQANQELKDLHVTLYDGAGKFLGLANAAQQLQGAYKDSTDQEKDFSLGLIFGNEQITAARLLMEAGSKGVNEYTKAVDDAGYAAQVAADKQNNLAGDVEKLGGSLDTALVTIGGQANGVLRDMVQNVTQLVDWFSSLDPSLQGVILVSGIAVAAVFLLGGAFLVVVPKIVAFREALTLLTTTMKGTALAGGAIGLAVTALVTILGIVASANADAAAKTAAYGDTLDKVTGQATNASRELAKTNLSAKGTFLGIAVGADSAYDAAKNLGLSLKTVTDAATGNGPALKKLQREIADINKMSFEDQQKLADKTGGSVYQLEAYGQRVEDAVKGESGSISEAIKIAETKQSVDGESADSNDELADSYQGVSDKVDGVVTSIKDLATELDKLNGVHLDARAAARQLEAAYDDFDAAVAKNGKTLDITTEKGRDNQAALDAIAKAALDSGEAIIDAGGGYEAYKASLEGSKAAIDDRIAKLGITGQAATDLSDLILHIPTSAEFTAYANTDPAVTKIQNLRAQIDAIFSRTLLVDLNGAASGNGHFGTYANGGFYSAFADGGFSQPIHAYAGGGTEHHVAQIARAGAMRVWAEPETGGEAYIPLHPSKRARSDQIMAETAARLGGTYTPAGAQSFADGGIGGGTTTGGSGVTIVNNIYPSAGMDEEALADKAAKKMAKALK